jgi:hypothetical protein
VSTFKVRLARAQWFETTVEADSQEAALAMARLIDPGYNPRRTWIGAAWSMETDDWMTLEDFLGENYDPTGDRKTVELIEEGKDDGQD